MKGAGLIISKELKRVFTSKQLVFSMFILPAILMFGIYGLMGNLIGSVQEDVEQHMSRVYIVDEPEGFEEALEVSGFEQTADIYRLSRAEYNADAQAIDDAIMNGGAELLVVFEENFNAKFLEYDTNGGQVPGLEFAYNSTEAYSSNAAGVFQTTVLEIYRSSLLTERFGDINRLNVFNTTTRFVEKEEKKGTEFISMMLPYMLVLMLFASAMGVVVDAIAGEKERGTMASMLLAPVKRSEIVVGKLVSLSIISALSALVYVVSMIFAMPLMGDAAGGEMNFEVFTLGTTLAFICNVLLLDLLFVSVISLLSVLAKDVKTASTFVSPCYIVVIMAGVLTMFGQIGETQLWQYAIPVYGNALLVQDVCCGEMSMSGFLVSSGSIIVCIILVIIANARAFKSEKIMFNA